MATYRSTKSGFQIKWREKKGDGQWTSRTITRPCSELEAQRLCIEVEQELAQRGYVDRTRWSSLPPASIVAGLLALIDSRVEQGKWTGKTPSTYRSYVTAIARALHAITGIPTDQVLPVTLLTRSTFEELLAYWRRDGRGQMATYGAARLLMAAWRWMASEPARWPHTPPPPFADEDYLPASPSYRRTEAPTLAHVDAMIRRLDRRGQHPETLLFAVFMRYLGLRGSQVAGLQLEDVDLNEVVLVVEVGKTKKEKRDRRVVPIPKRMLEERGVRELLTRAEAGPVFRGRGVEAASRSRRWLPDQAFAAAWELATEHDDVPREVWDPPQRRYARPTHALRAAYQGALEELGTPTRLVDYLVGHKGRSVRERHYGRHLVEEAREWVDRLPPVRRPLKLSDSREEAAG